MVLALGLQILMTTDARAQSSLEDAQLTDSGYLPLTAEERARMIQVQKVKLNQLGLERINAHLKSQGKPALDVQSVENGTEIEGVVGAEAKPTLTTDPALAAYAPAPADDAPAPVVLPSYVDNSTKKWFPPIRDQHPLGSCMAFSSIYYTMTHMTAMARNWDAKTGGDDYRFSPSFYFNMALGAPIARDNGCARWSLFPYINDNASIWCLNAEAWRDAINYRESSQWEITGLDATDHSVALNQLKTLLSNGYIANYGTGIDGWRYKKIVDDPSTTADDLFIGKDIVHSMETYDGGHAMTLVGYNDDLWCDVNGNGVVDVGEKGAIRVCNSWGPTWRDKGFTWVTYDSLRTTSIVAGAPARIDSLIHSGYVYGITARAAYAPRVLAKVVLNHRRKGQITVEAGLLSATGEEIAAPNSCLKDGYSVTAFDGGTTAIDGTFYFDLTDVVPEAASANCYVRLTDSINDDSALLVKSVSFIVAGTGVETICAGTPVTISNNSQRFVATVSNTQQYTGPVANAQSVTTAEDTPNVITLTGYDQDAAKLTYTIVTPPSHGTLSVNAQSKLMRNYTPTANYFGNDSFTFKVTNPSGVSAQAVVSINVTPVNDAPVANAQSVTTSTAKAIILTGSDVEGNALTYTVVTGPDHGALTGTPPNLTYTPAANYSGSDAFTFKATDPSGASSQAVVSITVPVPTITSLSPLKNYISGGTLITITGTFLTDTTSVRFGGTPATSVTVLSPNTVTCLTPAMAAGPVDVVLTTPYGSATQTAGYTYVPTLLYTITYNGYGSISGAVPVDGSSPYDPGSLVTVFGNIGSLVKTGYTFAGWNTAANGSGTAYAPADTFAVNADTSLYSQWTANSYTVSFHPNGGPTASPATKSVIFDGTYGTLASITRSGYTLRGWYTEAIGGTKVETSTAVTNSADHTLYAQWNAIPAVNAGVDQNVRLSIPPPWTPAEIPTIAWYDAADASSITLVDDKVSKWNDKSGNNRHASQGTAANRPAYKAIDPMINNLPSIGNIAATGQIGLNTPLMFAKSVYVVTYYKDGVDSQFDGYSTLFSGLLGVAGEINTADLLNTVHFNNYGVFKNGASGWSWTLRVLPMPSSILRVVHYEGSTQVFSLGFDAKKTDRDWQGNCSEWIFMDGTESDATRQKIEGYLAHKWGLAGSLPADHPYKSAAPGGAGVTANLDGTVSDAEGDALTTTWSLVSGPANVTFGNKNTVDTTAKFIAQGVYTLRLTTSDGAGSASDNCVITVGAGSANYTVTYNGNGSTGGTAPVDANSPYVTGATATVLGNTGSLVKTGNTFGGWNTAADGSGINYAAGATFVFNWNTTLYAKWIPVPTITTVSPNSGPAAGGTTVTITGTNLTGASAVTFGGLAATSVTVVSATSVTCVTPAKAAGAVNVVLTTPGGSVTKTNAFTYVAAANYTVTFNANGGSAPSPASKSVTFGETYGTLATTTRSGFTLKGWYSAATGGTNVESTTAVTTASNHTLYAQWNGSPAVNAGPDPSATMSVQIPWTPADLTIAAWYDASDAVSIASVTGFVFQWNDKSGNGKHLSQATATAQPMTELMTIGGKNAIAFDGSSDFLFTSTGLGSEISSLFIVMQSDLGLNSASAARLPISTYGDAVSTGIGLGSSTGALTNEVLSVFDEDEGGVYVDRQAASNSTLPSIDTTAHVYSFALNTDWHIGLDGSANLRDLSSGVRHAFKFANSFAVGAGARTAPTAGYFDGGIAEVLCVSSALSLSDRQKVEGYLAHKWGLVSKLPVGHPYKVSAPTKAGAVVTLNGTVSDADGDPVASTWSKVTGPGVVTFTDAASAATSASFSQVGGYTLRLTASDGSNSAYDECVITVKATPTVTAWPTAAAIVEGNPLSSATLSGGLASVAGSFGYDSPSLIPGAGTYAAAVTFTPTDSVSYVAIPGTVNVIVKTCFDAWCNSVGDVTFTGDANQDGVADGLAWLLGASTPEAKANGLVPSNSEVSNGALTLSFKLLKKAVRGSAVLKLQYSKDLGVTDPWTSHTITVPDSSGNVGGVDFTLTPIAGTDLNQVQATVPASAAGTGGKVFVRLNGEVVSP